LTKAGDKNAKELSFKDPRTAIVRMKGDIGVIREYFASLIGVFLALGRVVGNKFEILNTVIELMLITAGLSDANFEEQVFAL
jgi:hypothetical protein